MPLDDDRSKAMRYDYPEFIPVSAWILPAAWMKYREALEAIVRRHPLIIGDQRDRRDYDAVSDTYVAGQSVDEWGCVWSNISAGCGSYVSGHPYPDRAMISRLTPPAPGFGLPHGFMFLRLIYLRGYEEAMIDFAEDAPELQQMIDIVLAYNVGETTRLLREDPDMLWCGDDLGIQIALPISPEQWRRYLKPCYAKLYGMARAIGAGVNMHTDGHIIPIIADLIECGVTVLNPQIRANGLDALTRECKGKVCLNLDLDRQMFPFCTPAEIDAHVREVVETLGAREGGLWLTAEIGPDIPLENIEAICVALETYRGYYR